MSISHVVGYGWHEGVPRLRLAGREPLVLDGSIRLQLTSRRQCIGWRDRAAGERRPCPTAADPGGQQCLPCSRREGFWECMTCDGFDCPPLSPAMARYCQQDHVLYLANFGLTIKVGTASWPRRWARPFEQGPLVAARVAVGPGPVIKQIEALSAAMGYAEALRRSQKWREFESPNTPEQARERVLGAFEDIRARLEPGYEALLHPPRFLDLPDWPDLSFVDLLRAGPGDTIQGQVTGARGHVVVVDDGAGPFAFDAQALVGSFVELDPDGGAPVRQLGLFG